MLLLLSSISGDHPVDRGQTGPSKAGGDFFESVENNASMLVRKDKIQEEYTKVCCCFKTSAEMSVVCICDTLNSFDMQSPVLKLLSVTTLIR